MNTEPNRELIALNIIWLEQALALVEQLDDEVFAMSPAGLAPHRVGAHLRHILDFYECFFDGLKSRRIDYDSRKRDESVERDRWFAAAKIRAIIRSFEAALPGDPSLGVRLEGADLNAWLPSSVGRELQALSSHTIHHFALIAMTLRVHGVGVDPEFGMSPSTLRYQAAKVREAA